MVAGNELSCAQCFRWDPKPLWVYFCCVLAMNLAKKWLDDLSKKWLAASYRLWSCWHPHFASLEAESKGFDNVGLCQVLIDCFTNQERISKQGWQIVLFLCKAWKIKPRHPTDQEYVFKLRTSRTSLLRSMNSDTCANILYFWLGNLYFCWVACCCLFATFHMVFRHFGGDTAHVAWCS